MTALTRRRETFESKFAHDEALRFKTVARRNRLLGLWAAPRLGKSGEEAETYAGEVVMADLEETMMSGEVRRVLNHLMGLATAEIKAGM